MTARAPQGYSNLKQKIGPYPMYFHNESGNVALLTTPDVHGMVYRDAMKHFPDKQTAEAWVKERMVGKDVSVLSMSKHYPQTTIQVLQAHYDAVQEKWVDTRGLAHEVFEIYDASQEGFVEQITTIAEEYAMVTQRKRELERLWHEVLATQKPADPKISTGEQMGVV